MSDRWIPDYYSLHPAFGQLADFHQLFIQAEWPSLEQLNTIHQHTLYDRPVNSQKLPIKFVPQNTDWNSYDESYESRIYLTGEVQTRIPGWHDFFQVFIWHMYPRIKSAINQLHYQHGKLRLENRNNNRSPLENMLTLFDECGLVIMSSDRALLENIQAHNWRAVFQQQAAENKQQLKCNIFGHALFEKMINPYIGMTGNAILLHVDDRTFNNTTELEKTRFIDETVANLLLSETIIIRTRHLQPFPLLGLNNWWHEQDDEFYQNLAYFRPASRPRGIIIDCH